MTKRVSVNTGICYNSKYLISYLQLNLSVGDISTDSLYQTIDIVDWGFFNVGLMYLVDKVSI